MSIGDVLGILTALAALTGAGVAVMRIIHEVRSKRLEKEMVGYNLLVLSVDGDNPQLVQDKSHWNKKKRPLLLWSLGLLAGAYLISTVSSDHPFYISVVLVSGEAGILLFLRWLVLTPGLNYEIDKEPWHAGRELVLSGNRDAVFDAAMDSLRSSGIRIDGLDRTQGWITAHTGRERTLPSNWGERVRVSLEEHSASLKVTIASNSVSVRGATRNRDNADRVVTRLIK